MRQFHELRHALNVLFLHYILYAHFFHLMAFFIYALPGIYTYNGTFSSFLHSIDMKMVFVCTSYLVHYNRVQSLIISVLLLLFFMYNKHI